MKTTFKRYLIFESLFRRFMIRKDCKILDRYSAALFYDISSHVNGIKYYISSLILVIAKKCIQHEFTNLEK